MKDKVIDRLDNPGTVLQSLSVEVESSERQRSLCENHNTRVDNGHSLFSST